MKKIFYIFIVVLALSFSHEVHAVAFYTDFTNGSDNNDGLATTTAWQSLDQFTDNARSAGDILFVRRGMATTSDITDLTFTSDGTLNSPITITSDYDNLWSDFATSTQTYTPVFGSKAMIAGGVFADISVNDWIYVVGDCTETYNASTRNDCEFAYEVSAVTGTTLTLYLPYKGNQTGAGKSLRVMPDAPVWNTTTGNFQFAMFSDDYWYFKGLDVRGTDAAANIQTAFNKGTIIYDVVLQSDGVSSMGIDPQGYGDFVKKTRMFGGSSGIFNAGNGAIAEDILVNCDGAGTAITISSNIPADYKITGIEIVNCSTADFLSSATLMSTISISNAKRLGTYSTLTGSAYSRFYFEDDFGVPGANSRSSNQIDSNTNSTTTAKNTTVVRSGGGSSSQWIRPPSGTGNTGLSTNYFPYSFIKLFEYPIYTDDSSKTYTVYFNSTSTSAWTADPTASELYIECEYYNHATNAERKLTKSTGVVDFNGSTSWQALSVTCDPTQSGILYLRGWYGKPQESGKLNEFYVDNDVDIS